MNTKSPKIMILYASYGDGHYQATKAIESCFQRKGISNIILLDLMAEAHPLLNELTKFMYIQSFKALPSVYGWVYNMTRDMQSDTSFLSMINTMGMRVLKEIIAKEEPDLIIHTFPQLAMPKLIKKTGVSLPLVNIVTDFDLHGRWIHPEVDRYYVATEDLKMEIANRGISSNRVLASGIPLGPNFGESNISHTEILPKLDPTKKTVLLMAGAYGVMKGLRDICEALIATGHHQILVVCGRNKELFRGLKRTFSKCTDVHLYGYLDNIPEMMGVSDCIITKPGGITLSEALACRLPLFLYRPVPGQELNNALYLKRKGIAHISYDAYKLAEQIESLWSNESSLIQMQLQIEDLRKPEATEVIVNDILDQWFSPVPASSYWATL
ncbi:MGDG synthase family glycosyltransferase [Paenibacillus segetis]|uniref:Processive diacylglycerol beta-glucosyltransferase n=1 Tax=Paenibacillus segetis TaxID=1325360 RepID=A0ABQ1YVZ7_9BACL|nr:glycosyltransferase [Paenibacillus segetis]GGH38087.1 processive diacylglycerol beta-glucosyltransferase [Paenibacillus segetis]